MSFHCLNLAEMSTNKNINKNHGEVASKLLFVCFPKVHYHGAGWCCTFIRLLSPGQTTAGVHNRGTTTWRTPERGLV